MEKNDEELIHSLLSDDSQLKGLYEEHVQLEKELNKLQQRQHLSNAQETEKKRLQKLKLVGMDRIMTILAQHRPN